MNPSVTEQAERQEPPEEAEQVEESVGKPARRPGRSAAALLVAFAVYLALGVLLWWHAWSTHPTGVAACACNDPALFTWFLEWPAYAIAHGHNAFYSSSLFYPKGINLLSNTGVLTLGVPLAPVTWLFGPVATLNVASTLGPVLSSLSMYWLLTRWTHWAPAAFVGGLVFGFAPFALVSLAVAHLNTEILVLVPLMVACLDELFVRQRHRPLVVGGVLGILVTLQFFLSTEMLAIVSICGIVALVFIVAYAVLARWSEFLQKAPHALRGLGAAAVVAIVLLAYPVWFALYGPAHLSGLVWPNFPPGTGGIVLGDIWNLRFMSAAALRLFAGYEGPALPQAEYLGIGALVVLGGGMVAWHRDVRMWLFGALGVVSVALSLGITGSYWVPWRVLVHIPLIQNVATARFFAVTTFCVAVMIGIVVDRTRDLVANVFARMRMPHPATTVFAGLVALGVGAVAAVPMGSAVATNIPFTTEDIALPAWFADVAPHLPPGQVVLTFPPPVAEGSAMTWQAVDSLHFAMATGGGPGSIPTRAGKERAGLQVITDGSVLFAVPPPPTAANVGALRRALAGWGVTIVVVPDPADLFPRYNRAGSTSWALAFFTLAIGRQPKLQDGSWVWDDVQSPDPQMATTLDAFDRCTSPQLWSRLQAVPPCVAGASRRV